MATLFFFFAVSSMTGLLVKIVLTFFRRMDGYGLAAALLLLFAMVMGIGKFGTISVHTLGSEMTGVWNWAFVLTWFSLAFLVGSCCDKLVLKAYK